MYHFSEPTDFIGSLTPDQFAYSQALTRVDCRDPDSSFLLRRPADPNHFGGAVITEGDARWSLIRRWIAEGAPFDESRSFTEPGSDCGVVITDPEYRPAEGQVDSGIRADLPRVITIGGTSTVWVEFADHTKQFVDASCRQQLVDNHGFDQISLTASAIQEIPNSSTSLSCDAIAALPKQDLNSVPTPVQPGLDFEIREFAVFPDNTSFGTLRLKPGLLSMAHTGGRLFVAEQHEGKIWEFTNGVVQPWFDVHQAFINETGVGISGANLFHGGLRSVAFHPEFASNGKFYTSQMRIRPDNREDINYISDSAGLNTFTDSTLSEWTVDAAGNLIAHRELFRIGYPAEDHLMKQIVFNPAATPGSADYGLLYIGHGDGTPADSFGNGQNDDALGKILRINPLADGDQPYTIPASNPFVFDDSWETNEVYALGFRNPHHIAFAQDGTTMVADVGRANIEEVNVITAGTNHGWPDREGTFVHLKDEGGGFITGIAPLPDDDANLNFTYPAAQYGHIGSYGNPFTGHSIAGGYVVENGSSWDGQYIFGDFVNFGDVYHTSLQGLNDAVTQGAPDGLSQSVTRRARVLFDHDNNPATDAQIYDTMLGVINDSPRYFSHSGTRRADLRFGQGPGGEIYVMNKRNNTIYLVTNTLRDGEQPPATIAPVFTANLRHVAYSSTSAELFWDRATDDGFVQGYEIIRNGELLGVFDALSNLQEDLAPAVTYTFAITAIDTDGNRSDTASITFTTGGGGMPPTNSAPGIPGNLRADVYSETTAELFWEHALVDGFIQGYEIVRNDELLGVFDALSLFQSELDPAITYTYAVTTIDTDGNRSETTTIIVSTGNTGGNQPTGTAPSVPGNLRHLVYSGTSAEIFWDRSTDDGLVQGYEIIRNGEALGVRDVLGIFQDELDPAVTYTYSVTAIDTDGNRSETATIMVMTGSGDVNPPAGAAPSVPGNIRQQVYSATTAEIFWDRSTDDGIVQGYEIVRNGELLGVRDALGIFQDGLDPAVSYTFAITAIDGDGNRSETAMITVMTGNGGANTPSGTPPSIPGNYALRCIQIRQRKFSGPVPLLMVLFKATKSSVMASRWVYVTHSVCSRAI